MILPVVVFPDAEAVIINYLRDELDLRGSTADVVKEVPNPRPPVFVTVTRVGGIRQTVISDAALLAIECWAENTATGHQAAHDLAQWCRALIHALPGSTADDVPVYRVDDVSGPQSLPDPLSEQPRCTFTVQVHLRGATDAGS